MKSEERKDRGTLPSPILCLITDRKRFNRPLAEVVSEAVAGGVNLIQLREKDLSEEDLFELAMPLREITQGKALFLINGSLEVTKRVCADGVHLPSNFPLKNNGSNLFGSSVHSVKEAQRAQSSGVDFLQAGHIFPSSSHPGEPPRGTEFLRKIREFVALPLIAVGGITDYNAGKCIHAGASGVAVISAIGAVEDPRKAAQSLHQNLLEAWSRKND